MIDGMERDSEGNMRRGILQGVVNTTRAYKLGRGGEEKKTLFTFTDRELFGALI